MKVSLVLSFQRKNFFSEEKKEKTFNRSVCPLAWQLAGL
jgi:hypothetical protein